MIEGDVFVTIIQTPEFTPLKNVDTHSLGCTTEVRKLLSVMEDEESRVTLQAKLGLKSEKNFRVLYLRPALDLGLIEITIPDKPKSRMQKYRPK